MGKSMVEDSFELADVTMSQLRAVLWKEIDDLRKGQSTPRRANALSKLAEQILDSVRLEVQSKWARIASAHDVKKADLKSIT